MREEISGGGTYSAGIEEIQELKSQRHIRRERKRMKQEENKRKEMVYEWICHRSYVPMRFRDLAVLLHVKAEEKEELKQILAELQEEGKIRKTRQGRYEKEKEETCVGLFQGHARGFGFVCVPGEEADVFIGEESGNGAMDGDEVCIRIKSGAGRRRREGEVIRILKRGVTSVTGLYQQQPERGYGFVLPDNQRLRQDIFVPKEKSKGAKNGQKVTVRLVDYGDHRKKPEGEVTDILGFPGEKGVDILSLIKENQLADTFPERVLNRAQKTPTKVQEGDYNGRKDLREWLLVTIDGEDTKDFDDAVSLTKEGDEFCLGVHIADVANYVQENSGVDKEAKKRGTSVYLPDRVLPMLPEALSNGICSLKAGEDRLALSCLMRINSKGSMVGHEIAETVIRVQKRMTYEAVHRFFTQEDTEGISGEIQEMLNGMRQLSHLLQKQKRARGTVDFDFPEAKIELDENGKVSRIRARERNEATRLIEDFMVLANETVAEEYFWRELPFLYRNHRGPKEEKLKELKTYLHTIGYTLRKSEKTVKPREFQKLLTGIQGKPEEPFISRLVLRSMQQAKYEAENVGHFGLASSCYTHFTSPIRRYPDLQIHRIIKDLLRGRMNEEKVEHYRRILPEVAQYAGEMERKAEKIQQEAEKLKKAEFMEDHLGEVYQGRISGLHKWGIYVELANTVEGMISVAELQDDQYEYREQTGELVGIHRHRRFRLGEEVKVRVAAANTRTRTVDFELVEKGEQHNGKHRNKTDRQQ